MLVQNFLPSSFYIPCKWLDKSASITNIARKTLQMWLKAFYKLCLSIYIILK